MKKGFTLIEVLVSVAILSFIVAGIYAVLNMANKTYNEDMGLVDLQQGARQAMDGMTREIRQSGRSSPYSMNIDTNGSLTFSIPSISSIIYRLDNNFPQIIRQLGSTNKVLANDINTLNFCWWDGIDCCDPVSENCSNLQVLQIQIRATKTVRGRELCFPGPCDPVQFLTEQVRLRN